MRQVCHPRGELAGIVSDLVEWWTCLGCDCEQVVVEAEEVGQCLLRRGKRGQSGRHGWLEFVVLVAVEGVLVSFLGAVAGQPGEIEWPEVAGGEFGAGSDDG
jgi:hypothetical protein